MVLYCLNNILTLVVDIVCVIQVSALITKDNLKVDDLKF